MQISTMTLPIEAPLGLDSHRSRVAWQAQRLLSEAASQLGDLVRLSSHSQQQTWRQALRAVEQVSATLAQVARPPQRSRRYRYSLDWRRKFAALLRAHREERGLSRQQLADRCKLSIGTIRNIETLRVHPEIDTIERIVAVKELGLSLGALGLPQREPEREPSSLTPARADLRDHSG
jgi:ribosome-binding protein aMBF1 (putative translation factor)